MMLELASFSARHGGGQGLGPVSLSIDNGQRLAVIGASGAGKSTLAAAITGLLPSTASVGGAIRWRGEARLPRPGAEVGVVFQDASGSLDPLTRVGDQVREVVTTHTSHRGGAATARAVRLLEEVGLHDAPRAARAWPHQLSGGQRQRVALACALAGEPDLLIADETTSALDTVVQARIVELLDRLVHDKGMALLFVTHDIALAARLSPRIVVLDAGLVAERLEPGDRLASATHPATRALLDAHVDLATPPLIGSLP